MITLEAVELRGERPDTEVIFIYTDTRHSAQRFDGRSTTRLGSLIGSERA